MSFANVREQIKQHGVPGAIVYHAVHYSLYVVAFLVAVLSPIDVTPLANYASQVLGWELSHAHTLYAAAWVFAAVMVKVLIPLKLWLTIRLLPTAEPKLRRLWKRLRG